MIYFILSFRPGLVHGAHINFRLQLSNGLECIPKSFFSFSEIFQVSKQHFQFLFIKRRFKYSYGL